MMNLTKFFNEQSNNLIKFNDTFYKYNEKDQFIKDYIENQKSSTQLITLYKPTPKPIITRGVLTDFLEKSNYVITDDWTYTLIDDIPQDQLDIINKIFHDNLHQIYDVEDVEEDKKFLEEAKL